MRRLAVVLALLVAACGTTNRYRVLTGVPGPAGNQAEVAFVPEGRGLPASFTEVAIVQAVGHGTHADLTHVLEGLRVEAASLGCNAVVRMRIDRGATMAYGSGVAVRAVLPLNLVAPVVPPAAAPPSDTSTATPPATPATPWSAPPPWNTPTTQ
jgi:hypothetical protein